MLIAGVLLSACFSGSETGFYRVTRVRLVIRALGGDRISRGLLWLTNNPALFVATTLIGNNVANYITSLAIVLAVQAFFGDSALAELAAPVLLAPVLFVYGELLPKNLFYYAPNTLLHRCGPLFMLFAVLFLPVAVLLWLLGRALQSLVGEAPERVRLRLARSELAQVLEEGHQAGVLRPSQRRLAHGLFAAANVPVVQHSTPPGRMATLQRGAKKADALRLARRHRLAAIPIEEGAGQKRSLIGYIRVIDLHCDTSDTVQQVREMIDIPADMTHIAALIRLESSGETLARVVNSDGDTVGLLDVRKLNEPLFHAT